MCNIIIFNQDPDPFFLHQQDPDPDPDPSNIDPDPQHCLVGIPATYASHITVYVKIVGLTA